MRARQVGTAGVGARARRAGTLERAHPACTRDGARPGASLRRGRATRRRPAAVSQISIQNTAAPARCRTPLCRGVRAARRRFAVGRLGVWAAPPQRGQRTKSATPAHLTPTNRAWTLGRPKRCSNTPSIAWPSYARGWARVQQSTRTLRRARAARRTPPGAPRWRPPSAQSRWPLRSASGALALLSHPRSPRRTACRPPCPHTVPGAPEACCLRHRRLSPV